MSGRMVAATETEDREASLIRKMNAEHEGGCHTHLGEGPKPQCPLCKVPEIVVHLTERQARAVTHAADLGGDVLASADMPSSDALTLGLARLASALERQGVNV